jgi:hypothetical protein
MLKGILPKAGSNGCIDVKLKHEFIEKGQGFTSQINIRMLTGKKIFKIYD